MSETVVINLAHEAMRMLSEAAGESNWIPPEYIWNDWLSDCADFLRTGEGLTKPWRDMGCAPHDRPILVKYDHDADPYRDPEHPGTLTSYARHAEGGDFMDKTGVTIARWCESYQESNGWEAGDSWWMPAAWFAWFNGDYADQVVNPIAWQELPE